MTPQGLRESADQVLSTLFTGRLKNSPGNGGEGLLFLLQSDRRNVITISFRQHQGVHQLISGLWLLGLYLTSAGRVEKCVTP